MSFIAQIVKSDEIKSRSDAFTAWVELHGSLEAGCRKHDLNPNTARRWFRNEIKYKPQPDIEQAVLSDLGVSPDIIAA